MYFLKAEALLSALLAGFILVVLTGCGSFGAKAMRSSRIDYNAALQQSNEEQLLANLVRLRYMESPSFLEIEGITTQLSLSAEASAGFDYERQDASDITVTDVFSVGGGAGFSSNPTITFTPLQGQEFLELLLRSIEIEKIMLLYNSGWTLKRILRLTVQSINGIPNAKRASGPTPEDIPEYAEFDRIIELMGTLERRDQLEFVFETYEEKAEVALVIDDAAWQTPEAIRLAELLDIEPGLDHYSVIYYSYQKGARLDRTNVMLQTRSLLGVLFFLSHNVKVPQKDLDEGIVRTTLNEEAEPFDWSDILHDMFVVRNAYVRPENAAVAMYYRGSWFYISDTDIESKATLMLVFQLLALQSGKTDSVTPLLTLPVGR